MNLKNLNHHAILVEGNPTIFFDMIKTWLMEIGVVFANNPDIIFISFDKFGIDESRQIIEISNGAPIKEEKKMIIFSFESITIDAQNALLKILEDPSPNVEFILGTHTACGLISTFQSRLSIIKTGSLDVDNSTQADVFIKSSIKERMDIIDKLLKDYKDSGNKFNIKNFLFSIHNRLEVILIEDNTIHNRNALKVVDKSLEYLDDKSAGVKILLESVALSV